MLRQPASIDARWKIGGQAMLAALRDILTCGITAEQLEEATATDLPEILDMSKSLKAIYHAAGLKGVHAVATR
eukprot:15818430-Heterocapsa_arctica.AAC.1